MIVLSTPPAFSNGGLISHVLSKPTMSPRCMIDVSPTQDRQHNRQHRHAEFGHVMSATNKHTHVSRHLSGAIPATSAEST